MMLAHHHLLVARHADQAQPRQMAWLIDGDNISPRLMPQVFAAAAAEGNLTERRVYGDWRSARLAPWSDVCRKYAIKQIQVTPFRRAKNVTDMQLVIDALDLCLTGQVDSVCIVSGDSDFAPVALRLREHEIFVLGIGASTAVSPAFAAACDRYQRVGDTPARSGPAAGDRDAAVLEADDLGWIPLVKQACENSRDGDGWVDLGYAGNHIRALHRDFDARAYGYSSLSALVASRPDLFEIQVRQADPTVAPSHWIRIRTQHAQEESESAADPNLRQPPPNPPHWPRLMTQVYAHSITSDGWMPLGWAGERIKEMQPDFRPQWYGFTGLLEMLESRPDLFRINQRTPPDGGPPVAYTRPTNPQTVTYQRP